MLAQVGERNPERLCEGALQAVSPARLFGGPPNWRILTTVPPDACSALSISSRSSSSRSAQCLLRSARSAQFFSTHRVYVQRSAGIRTSGRGCAVGLPGAMRTRDCRHGLTDFFRLHQREGLKDMEHASRHQFFRCCRRGCLLRWYCTRCPQHRRAIRGLGRICRRVGSVDDRPR